MDVRHLLIWGSRGHWKAATRHPSGPIEASSQVPEIFGDGNPQENSDEKIRLFFFIGIEICRLGEGIYISIVFFHVLILETGESFVWSYSTCFYLTNQELHMWKFKAVFKYIDKIVT